MIDWLKGLGVSFKVGFIAFLAAMAAVAALRHKRQAEKWRDRAVDSKTGFVKEKVGFAAGAMTQAKLHEAKAHEAEQKGVQHVESMGKQNDSIADILDRFKRSS